MCTQVYFFLECTTIYITLLFFSPLLWLFAWQIRWENRFWGDSYQRRLVTVDGVDFQIKEPIPFSTRWHSHKFNGPGLQYEVVVWINAGDIVLYHGPFPCGSFPDIKIFRLGVKLALGPGEKVVADQGYKGDTRVCTPDDHNDVDHKKAMIRAQTRHETMNSRLKTWASLKKVYHYARHKHHLIFWSVLVLTQIRFENGYPPFQETNFHDPAEVQV